jgi:hypothetical protein
MGVARGESRVASGRAKQTEEPPVGAYPLILPAPMHVTPAFYTWLLQTGLIDFSESFGKWQPWVFLPESQFVRVKIGFAHEAVASTSAVVFMRRQDCDLAAAFECVGPGQKPRVFLVEWWGNDLGPACTQQVFADGWEFLKEIVLDDVRQWSELG